MKTILLTNKSTRKYTTSKGDFHPGTTIAFDEREAMGLLNYKNDIVKSDESIVGDLRVKMDSMESKVDDLTDENEKLKAKNKKLEAEIAKLKK